MTKGLREGVLHRLFRILDISKHGQSHTKYAAFMSPHEGFESPAVAAQNPLDQQKIVLGWTVFS
ncbi:MAG TPA: hypothetical protein VGS20_10700 [Candidatus Acidoferrales bacterium]|nr:hypothetical protein [Candidatus Acidoferrales bacterium]